MIGILSGIGAAAGAHFYSELIAEYQRRGAEQDSDFPEVVLYNIPFNGTDLTGVASIKHFMEDLKKGIKKLNSCEVDKIVVICNTAYLYFEKLQAMSDAEILNIVDITREECKGSKYGIICSRTAKEENLYFDAVFCTTEKEQVIVDELIQKAISGKVTITDRLNMQYLLLRMFRSGAEKVVLGCTELPLVMPVGDKRNLSYTCFSTYEGIIDVNDCIIKKLLESN